MIDEIINEKIEMIVRREVSEQLAPIKSLPERFANKITLSIADMCEILGVEDNKAGKEAVRRAARAGQIPCRIFGRDYIFPRPMVESYLFGEWKAKEVEQRKVNVIGLADKIR